MPATEEFIEQLERSALDRCIKGDMGGFGELYADDVSYFDPLTRARIDGAQAMRVYQESLHDEGRMTRYEMANADVVDADKFALLTYNLTTYRRESDGSEAVDSCWNCTEVYRKDERWRIIHSHWSHTAHEAFREPPAEGEAGA
jgi:ketosteroid isomerase-like protein